MKNHNWKSNYLSTLQSEIDKIKDEGHYRVFNNIEEKPDSIPKLQDIVMVKPKRLMSGVQMIT